MTATTPHGITLISPHTKDLGGGFLVRRSLPSLPKPAVGPFVFFDHFGPVEAHDTQDVRAHPHIGLATVTYLYQGAMVHRDSTGAVQRIEPGAVNLMVAGSGVAHSERMPDELRGQADLRHGLQLWLALPEADEEMPAFFSHTGAADIPEVVPAPGVVARVLMGSGFGATSPVPQRSPTLYIDLRLSAGAELALPPLAAEQALYAVEGGFLLDGEEIGAQTMALLPEGATCTVAAPAGARIALVGGEPLGQRYMWWNFVSSRKERIVQAADDWQAQRFAAVPGETEFIPLPQKRPT
ncbi:pirin family protein [Aquincola sp. J276]|uniref:pirin family protein n=1 Tax=Aquincola sp. J276 TaxID=2898432 RepID=UPI0021509F4C|nr:pirin family protein [Aquincola sp. J276]MCR5866929.1 pirin family protein [Aquincola sp. J276]